MSEVTVNIQGSDYFIRTFKGSKSFKVKMQLADIIAAVGGAIGDDGVDLPSMVKALKATMTVDQQLEFIKLVLSEVYKGTQLINFDDEFEGCMLKMYELAIAVLDHNYKDVFQMLGISIPK